MRDGSRGSVETHTPAEAVDGSERPIQLSQKNLHPKRGRGRRDGVDGRTLLDQDVGDCADSTVEGRRKKRGANVHQPLKVTETTVSAT